MKKQLKDLFLDLHLFGDDNPPDDDDLDLDDIFDDDDDDDDDDKGGKDGKTDEEKAKEKEKKKQDRKKNAEEARKRREKERQEAIDKAAKEAYEKGLREGKRGALKINTFTNEPIEDDVDVANFELMQKLKEEGKDPIKDFPQAKAKLEREARDKAKKAKEEEDQKAAADKKKLEDEKKDRADFVKLVGGKDKALEIFKDPDFKLFAKYRVGNEPLTEIYKDYMAFMKKFKGEDGQKTPPGAGDQHGGGGEKKDPKKMSYEEHKAYMKGKYGG